MTPYFVGTEGLKEKPGQMVVRNRVFA